METSEQMEIVPSGGPVAAAGPVVVCMEDIEASEIEYVWRPRIPRGRITLLVGRPGEGKSFLTTDMAAHVSTGTPWPDGAECPQGSVLFITAEDDPSDTIKPRLTAHGADCRKVHLLCAVRNIDSKGKLNEVMFTLADVAALKATLERLTDCVLVVIDPVGSFLGGSTDAHRDNEVRGILAPVGKIAEKFNVAVLIVMHRRKGVSGSADDSALGSRAFTGIARAVWHLSRDPQSKDRRLLLAGKNNLAPDGDGLAFTITGTPPAIVWEKSPVKMGADEAFAAEGGEHQRPGPDAESSSEVGAFLNDVLREKPLPAVEVFRLAKVAGFSEGQIRRVKGREGIKSRKCGMTGQWVWEHPGTAVDALLAAAASAKVTEFGSDGKLWKPESVTTHLEIEGDT